MTTGTVAPMNTALAMRSRAVLADVASDDSTTSGVADQDDIGQVEKLQEFVEVIDVGVDVVAFPGLAGPSVPATVVSDDPVALGCEEEHLVLERVRVQGVGVKEDDGLSGSPVLDVEAGAVLGGEVAHGFSSG
jgi:hypothetical protein